MDLAKAQYAVGYFTEVGLSYRLGSRQTGIGTDQDLQGALGWYRKAAENGDSRARKRLDAGSSQGMQALDRKLEMEAMKEDYLSKGGKKESCTIM